MRPAKTTVIAFVLALTFSACSAVTRPAPSHPTPDVWGALLAKTDSLASAGRHAQADSVLVAFAEAHPGSRAAHEVPFWRALYKLDPRNQSNTRSEGRRLMDSYAAASDAAWYKAHANVLRHIAQQIVDAEVATGDSAIVPGDTSMAGIAARDRVIRNQRAEIARLNAELERIKRRLASPTP